MLLCHPGHRLAARARVRLPDLADEPFADFGGSGIEVLVARRFADAGVRHHRVCEATHPPLLVDLVAAGVGVSIVPRPANPAARALPAHLPGESSAVADEHEEQREPGEDARHRDGGQAGQRGDRAEDEDR
ncbi:LysR substrate-binding domain-containing protein [Amycolatopsis sp. cmx-4-83]|uniref:LysR substrate-binding domain-containing protein n=1 Tax=Amycolatopsis sp. cmx-4-83 TaxID=2790940 RepID=UPI00397D0462